MCPFQEMFLARWRTNSFSPGSNPEPGRVYNRTSTANMPCAVVQKLEPGLKTGLKEFSAEIIAWLLHTTYV
ncbi:uncharacterized [Tachysurus ichikawai]